MSHFTVLVVGENPEEQLAPYKEGIDDVPKENLVFVDKEEEYQEKWEKNEEKIKEWYPEEYTTLNKDNFEKLNKDGEIELAEFKETFKLPKKGKRWSINYSEEKENGDIFHSENIFAEVQNDAILNRDKQCYCNLKLKKITPPIETPIREAYKTFEEYVKDYCSYSERDPEKGRYGYWDNPKAKWDWYQLGGRWTGVFKLKQYTNLSAIKLSELTKLSSKYNINVLDLKNMIELYEKGYQEFEKESKKYYNEKGLVITYDLQKEIEELIKPKYANAKVGKTGLMTDIAKEGYADQVRKKDIDFEGMVEKVKEDSKKRYETIKRIFGGKIPEMTYFWKKLLEGEEYKDWSIDRKRKVYHDQPAMKLLKEIRNKKDLSKEDKDYLVWLELEGYQGTEEEYITSNVDSAFVTFAVVKDGKWYERGEMGWWGVCLSEKEDDLWVSEFNKLLKEASDDTLLSVYDCHI